ncbi:hypothetical protein FH972_020614 [Carpinus fangiana]|uniref:TFIIS-type domain-containing protein n=1 Tax=Carpinus fangiana TaxID=176857 RepID=A0A5N6RTZ8_9ROSI|nr:hypothetical protein FH972_020614 [Carpinus fangiana]
MGLLSKLQNLSLYGNGFSGTIPPSLSNISSLQIINLSYNQLSGSIPSSIFNVYNLQGIDLKDNLLSGPMPSNVSNMSSLQVINLRDNNFNGSVPLEIGNLIMLKELNLGNNIFGGTIPPTLFKCKQLQILSLSKNKFTGRVPLGIGNVTILKKLSLSHNNFGEEPKRLGKVIKSAYREKVRKELEWAFSRVANEADKGGVKPDVTACDPVRVTASVEPAMFRKIGWSNGIKKAKYRSVVSNLNDPENPDLRKKVLLGQIKSEVLVTMSAMEMASQKMKRENIKIPLTSLSRCLHDADLKEKASIDMFQCSWCRERKCTYYQLQTRSADEPMTTYVTCINCNNHWKFS